MLQTAPFHSLVVAYTMPITLHNLLICRRGRSDW